MSFNSNSDSIGRPSRSAQSGTGRANIASGMTAGAQVFDYEGCLARLGGDRELFDEILDIFLEDAPPLLSQASTSLARGDSAALERATHTLKGLSANFAAAAAVTAAYAVELHARDHRLDSAAICFPQLEAEVHRLEVALRNFRQQHP
ncbi:MAG: Hpt domain-containing protein [Pirellulales bacterium]